MRTVYCMIVIGLVMCGAGTLPAEDFYVAQSGQTPTDFKSWAGAASNIQDAVNAAAANDTVWVSNGTYTATANEVVLLSGKPLRLRGTGDRDAIIIDGEGVSGNRRGIRVNNPPSGSYTLIDGFTVTNCILANTGAGMFLYHPNILSGTAVVQNCVIAGNQTTYEHSGAGGGGLYSQGQAGSDFLTVISNCSIVGNMATNPGAAGLRFRYGRSLVQDCHISGNKALGSTASGGGVRFEYAAPGSLIKDCVIEHNTTGEAYGSGNYGGGIMLKDSSSVRVENCRIQYNVGGYAGGLAAHSSSTGTLYNCLISHNRSDSYGGGLFNAHDNALLEVDNCTIVSNRADLNLGGGGIYRSAGTVNVRNSIVYYNITPASSSSNTSSGVSYSYSCVAPLQAGPSNIVANPQFVDLDGGDFHLTKTSPCFNTGTNILSWMDGAVDLDGYPRIDSYIGIVDRGCYELPPRGTVISIQ